MLRAVPKPTRKKRVPSLLRRSKSPVEANPLEETDQLALVQWLRLHNICFHHSPNGGYRHKVTAVRLKAMGASSGFPDIIILDPPPAYCGLYHSVAIELKRKKGGVLSDTQSTWLEKLNKRGWCCKVAHGLDEAIEFLDLCGYGKRP